MCFVYILHSEALDRYYVGATCDDLESRINKHLSKHRGFTARTKDWVLVYHEAFQTKQEAFNREKQIKSWKSKIKIKQLIRDHQS